MNTNLNTPFILILSLIILKLYNNKEKERMSGIRTCLTFSLVPLCKSLSISILKRRDRVDPWKEGNDRDSWDYGPKTHGLTDVCIAYGVELIRQSSPVSFRKGFFS